MKKLVAALTLGLLVLPMVAALVSSAAPVQTIVIKRIESDDNAIGSLLFGSTQARLFRLKNPDVALKLEEAGFRLVTPFSGMDNLLINPSHCRDGSLNIFTNQKARFALEFLVPRSEVVANILKGFGIPMYIPWTPFDPDYPYLVGTALKAQFLVENKGEAYGKQLLQEALKELGATQGSDGKWYYQGKPVTVNFVIRVEDERKDIGNLVARKLEEAGLTVNYLYKDFSGAVQIVYYGDAGACEWQIYTEGWGITGMTKYDYGSFVYFYSTIWGNVPDESWGGDYKNETIDDIATRLDTGNYTGEDEYWSLVNEGTWLGFSESVRVFIVATQDIYPMIKDIGGIIESPKATPWNYYTYVTINYPKDTLYFSNRYVYNPGWVWNPVGGYQDMYSAVSVRNAVYFSFGVTTRITDGEPGWSPGKATSFNVEKNATIPGDALVYSPSAHRFMTAAEAGIAGEKAVNEIIYNYKVMPQVKYHDGSQMTVADLLAPIAVIIEWGTDASTNTTKDVWYERRIGSLYSTFISSFKAIKVINSTAVAVYTDYDHLDKGIVAAMMDVWSSTPLELYAAMDMLARSGKGYVWHYADQKPSQGIYAIHLIDPTQVGLMVNLTLSARDNPPYWVRDLVGMNLLTLQEWQARADNLVAFASAKGHLVIGEGPYYLDKYDSVNDQATLKRWGIFPLDPQVLLDELAKKTVSMSTMIAPVAINKAGSVIATLNVQVNNQPALMDQLLPYALLINLDNYQIMFLNIKSTGAGQFQVVLPKDVTPGYYQLSIMVYPKGYSNPALESQVVNIVAPTPTTTTTTPSPTPTTTTTTVPPTTTPSPTPTTTTTTVPPTTTPSPTPTTTPPPSGISGTTIAVIIIVIIILAAAYYYLRK